MGIQYPPNVDDAVDSAGILSIGNTAKMIAEIKSDRKSSAKVRQITEKIAHLEEEIKTMGTEEKKKKIDKEEEESEEDDEVSLPEIDDDEDEEEEEEEEGESEDDASDPDDDDIPVHVSNEDAASKKAQVDTKVDTALVGGAVDVADEESICSSLFKGMNFFLGREVPREQLSLVIQSFGGIVGWDGEGSPFDEMDEKITHQIIDRPKPLTDHKNRIFVQPQWVFDSTNARVLVDAAKYAPGVVPPPHLSPFVQPEEEDHIPDYAKEIKELKDAAQRSRLKAAGEAVDDEFLGKATKDQVADAERETDLAALEQQHAEELAKEIKEATGKVTKTSTRASKRGRKEVAKDDEDAMKDIMMTRKVKRAYQKAMEEKASKRAKTARLAKRAADLKSK